MLNFEQRNVDCGAGEPACRTTIRRRLRQAGLQDHRVGARLRRGALQVREHLTRQSHPTAGGRDVHPLDLR